MAYQKDISAILGLSVSTVSRALKGYPDISEETRQKVLRTAEEIDYRYKRRKSLSSSVLYSGAVGVLAPGIRELLQSAYYREMLCAMTVEAASSGRDLVVMGAVSSESGVSWMGRVTLRNTIGVCFLAEKANFYRGEFADLFESGIPLVSIEHEIAGHVTVYSSLRDNIRLLLDYMSEKGHITVVYIGRREPRMGRQASLVRHEAEKLDMAFLEWRGEFPEPMEVAGILKQLKAACVLFESNEDAEKYMAEWKKNECRIPEEFSVAALEMNQETWGTEEITTVKNCPGEIGRVAVRKLLSIAEHPETDCGERIMVPGEIWEKGTVGRR